MIHDYMEEAEYRRGYRDGWIECNMAIFEAMREHHIPYDDVRRLVWEHWERDLEDWEVRSKRPDAVMEHPPIMPAIQP